MTRETSKLNINDITHNMEEGSHSYAPGKHNLNKNTL